MSIEQVELIGVLGGCGLFLFALGYLLGHVGGRAAGIEAGLKKGVELTK
jgi:hypothetical protein